MPIANGFLLPENFASEYFFELAPAFCENCKTFQIVDQPDPSVMFHDQYAFFTRTSQRMVSHFADYAGWVHANYVGKDDPFVVEIGSNDGAMLENFSKLGIRHLGIEPSANVAAEAKKHGVRSLVAFFGPETAKQVVDENGAADAIIAANVMCHIPDLNGVAQGADMLLTDQGVLIFEDPYLGAMVAKTSYDQIYDEHVFIFSATSVQAIFGRHGFELIDVLAQSTHGGSMRYVLGRKGHRTVSPNVATVLKAEQDQGLSKRATYDQFRRNCEASRTALISLLEDLRRAGKRIVGYGATSKSTTVLNYCGLTSYHIEFISDTTPIKQGKYTPGSHIQVKPYEAFVAEYPEYALLFAWNHAAEILAKEDAFTAAGGQWIGFVPKVGVIDL